ncbi:MAG TPA: methyltransferase domain-containing protein [Polyangiaceae bacterium]
MSSLPDYAAALSAFHRCAGDSLHAIVRSLPLTPGMRVLDAPCGDGTYLPWLRECVGDSGRVVGADRSAAFLELASEQRGAELVQADFDDLPSPFDFAWCAHSLYSLPDPAAGLASLRRVLVPGGRIGILENDSFHHWLLPWPIELEVAVKRAQLDELAATTPHWTKAYVGRNLGALLHEAGFLEIVVRTLSVDHRAPLSEDEKLVLRDYLSGLRKLTWKRLEPSLQRAFEEFETSFAHRTDFTASHLEVVATAKKPDAERT